MQFLVVFACVLLAASALECGPNSHYTTCLSNCPLTCATRDNPMFCTLECRKDGCQCDEDYILDNEGNCVLDYQCPQFECAPNEKYNYCGNGCGIAIEDNCPNKKILQYERPIICPAVCKPICECKPGFARNSQMQCVEPEDC